MPYIGFSGVSPAKGFGWSSGPSDLVVDYLVVAGGGAGGHAGGGGAGGFRAITSQILSLNTAYSVTVGGGGSFGQPTSRTDVAEGTVATTGTNVKGQSGGGGGNSVFTYNSTAYTSSGGAFGTGGAGGNDNTTGTGGTGGAVASTPSPTISKAGSNGAAGTNNNAASQAGGAAGNTGNKGATNTYQLLNYGILDIATTNYGNGGAGGQGEASNDWAGAGYNGRPGIVLVFYYYE